MSLDDVPGRERAESLRQWPVLRALAARAGAIEALDGLIVIGSFAAGNPDELSDIDALAVAAPGRFEEAWAGRHRLAGDALLSWDRLSGSEAGCHTWLTRDLVKVECEVVDPASGSRELVDPCFVLAGDPSTIDRFPRITPLELGERRRRQREEQGVPADPERLSYGELIDWKISELKHAVRRGLRETNG
jgi:predicted nucleotidyltransferase